MRAWHEVESDFNECEYQAVRDRQMRELELEDDVMSKVPIRCVLLRAALVGRLCSLIPRNMRAKLYKESFEFVRQQRIHCLMQGAWFMNAMPLVSNASRDTIRKPSRPWRFMRLVIDSIFVYHLTGPDRHMAAGSQHEVYSFR